MYLRVEMPRSAGIEATLELVRQLDEDLRAEPLIRRVDWSVGEVRPPSTTTCAPTSAMHPVGRKDGAHARRKPDQRANTPSTEKF